jgi:4'-phosphopantetheinyl transferase
MEQVEFHFPTTADFQVNQTQVHIWYIDLDDEIASFEEMENLLSIDERERAKRLRREIDRKRFLRVRSTLRIILSLYVNLPPKLLRFCYGEYGKPTLELGIADNVHFNLTHSNKVALIAVNGICEVGIDVEAVRADFDMERLAKRFLSEADWQRISAAPIHKQEELFFSCWVLKEAYLKAQGWGLGFAEDQARIVCHGSTEASNNFILQDPNGAQWWAQQFSPLSGYIAALVSERQWQETTYFRWHRDVLAMVL